MATTDFYELGLPVCDEPNYKTNWCMRNESGEPYYLLNYTLHMGHLNDYQDIDFYFSTEAIIHAHAAKYYAQHGESYPYASEWQSAVSGEPLPQLAESQVMEFI